jgi:ribose-phosphate pyrophosphokinase
MVFTGNSNVRLANDIAQELGVPMGKAVVGRFSDGEVAVEIMENIRGRDIYLIQSTCAPQDRRPRSARVPITAKVAAKMISAVGTDRVLTIDLHADQIQGFFDIPVDNVYVSPLTMADIWRHQGSNEIVVVSPDVGGVVRARAIAKRLDVELAIIDKRRPRANVSKVMNVIGEIEGKTCVMVDDMVDTAGTLCTAAAALKDHGAVRVAAYCVHPILSGNAIENISNSELDELVVTDTIPLSDEALACDRIRQLSVAQMLAETIRRMAQGESVSSMYMD